MVVDSQKKETLCDLTKPKHHAHNQCKSGEDGNVEVRRKKMWQALLDSKSTCDFIINPKLVKNI